MPWHDIAAQFQGEIVLDLVSHFLKYWDYATSNIKIANRFVTGAPTTRMRCLALCYQGGYYIRDLCKRCCKCCYAQSESFGGKGYAHQLDG